MDSMEWISFVGLHSEMSRCRVWIGRTIISLDFSGSFVVPLTIFALNRIISLFLYIPATEGSAVGQERSGFSNGEHGSYC